MYYILHEFMRVCKFNLKSYILVASEKSSPALALKGKVNNERKMSSE